MTNRNLEDAERDKYWKRPGKGIKIKRGKALRFHVYLTDELAQHVYREAVHRGVGTSAIIRDMVRAAVDLEDE